LIRSLPAALLVVLAGCAPSNDQDSRIAREQRRALGEAKAVEQTLDQSATARRAQEDAQSR
jgi:hypothetical protein